MQCDGCHGWQHRICDTGISLQRYRHAVANELDIDWECRDCRNDTAFVDQPEAESTRIDEGNQQVDDVTPVDDITPENPDATLDLYESSLSEENLRFENNQINVPHIKLRF